jgi:MFS family permease
MYASKGILLSAITPKEGPTSPNPSSLEEKRRESSIAEESPSNLPSSPYSFFTKRQKWLIVFLGTFAATFSPLSSFVFFPAITAISESLHVSIGRINLTITSYMIVAGIAPAFLGNLADTIGRRAVYLLMMGIYCVANVGLALQSNWTALFILRMVQSAGSAGRQSAFLLFNTTAMVPGVLVSLGPNVVSLGAESGGASVLVFLRPVCWWRSRLVTEYGAEFGGETAILVALVIAHS